MGDWRWEMGDWRWEMGDGRLEIGGWWLGGNGNRIDPVRFNRADVMVKIGLVMDYGHK
jgi:hypothetical protein